MTFYRHKTSEQYRGFELHNVRAVGMKVEGARLCIWVLVRDPLASRAAKWHNHLKRLCW
jgi:hypothetical protein